MPNGRMNWGHVDLASTAAENILNITASSQQYTLPVSGGEYIIIASGNSVCVEEGSNPTAVYPVTDERGLLIGEGMVYGPMKITGPKVAYIGPSATGWVQFIYCKRT